MSLFFSRLPYKFHRVYMTMLAVLVLLTAGTDVHAQPAAAPASTEVGNAPGAPAPAGAPPAAPEPSAPPAPLPAPPAAPAAEAAALAALSAKVEEADQNARIAARKVELLEEQLASKAKDSPGVLVDDRGFGIRSADGASQLRIHGQLQADSRWFLGDTSLSDRLDTFLLRRFRPGFDGTLFNIADFRFTPDFAGGTTVVFDAYADIHPTPYLRLRAGKFKTPLGLERLQADQDLVFIERALTQFLTPTRDVGLALWGDVAGGIGSYSVGVYNGGADNSNADLDSNHAKDFTARLLIQPFKAEPLRALGALGLHIAVSKGDRRGLPTAPQLGSYKTSGQNTFFSYLAPASDPDGSKTVFAYLTQSRIDPGIFYYYGPFGVLGEAVWSRQEVRKGNATATLTNKAVHATASVVLGGKNGYDGATPSQPLDFARGTLGALELAVRWNRLQIDGDTFPVYADMTKSASKAQGWAAAANYVPNRTLRLAVNYERTSFTGGAGTASAPKDRNTESVVIGRVQINF